MYGHQPAQPEVRTYTARRGVEYLITTMYDEDMGEAYAGKEVAEWCMAKLEKIMGHYDGNGSKPELIKKWVGPVMYAEFHSEKGGGLLGLVYDGTVKIICYADPESPDTEEEVTVSRCKEFEGTCYTRTTCWRCGARRSACGPRLSCPRVSTRASSSGRPTVMLLRLLPPSPPLQPEV